MTGTASFVKRVENNLVRSRLENIGPDRNVQPVYNLDGKTESEKLFFGDCNALAEFFYVSGQDAMYGFRLVKMPEEGGFILEVKDIPNFVDVNKRLEKEFPSESFSGDRLESLTDSIIERSIAYNKIMYAKRQEESLKRYEVRTVSVPVDESFAMALYEKMLAVIDGFDSRYEGTAADDAVVFRCVAGNEVRMLRTDDELQGKARALAELCQRIVREIDAHETNKEEYVRVLETF